MNRVAVRCSVHRVSLFEAPFAGLRMALIASSPVLTARTIKIIAPLLRGMH